jgi:hypothetical protein
MILFPFSLLAALFYQTIALYVEIHKMIKDLVIIFAYCVQGICLGHAIYVELMEKAE